MQSPPTMVPADTMPSESPNLPAAFVRSANLLLLFVLPSTSLLIVCLVCLCSLSLLLVPHRKYDSLWISVYRPCDFMPDNTPARTFLSLHARLLHYLISFCESAYVRQNTFNTLPVLCFVCLLLSVCLLLTLASTRLLLSYLHINTLVSTSTVYTSPARLTTISALIFAFTEDLDRPSGELLLRRLLATCSSQD